MAAEGPHLDVYKLIYLVLAFTLIKHANSQITIDLETFQYHNISTLMTTPSDDLVPGVTTSAQQDTTPPPSPATGGKIPLHVMGFASINISADGWSSAGCIPAIEMALEDVNQRQDILQDYHLHVDIKDSQVSS